MMRHIRRIGSLVVLAVIVAIGAFMYDPRNLFDYDPPPTIAKRDTGVVRTQVLTSRLSADGSLLFAESLTIHAYGTGAPGRDEEGSATVTAIVEENTTVVAGTVLWRTGLEPMVALYGDLPSYRDLGRGDVGPDVSQLEDNLVALGFDPQGTVTVDETFTYNTGLMVKRWQEAIGAEATGEVAHGSVVHLPAPRRVGSVELEVGDTATAGTEVLQLTAPTRELVFTVSAADRTSPALGDTVTGRLSGREEFEATVSTITVDDTGGATITAIPTTAVEVSADQVPVTVSWTMDLTGAVLTVPESALLRIDAATYVVERRDAGGSDEMVPVVPGVPVDGWIAVTGDLEDGDEVIAP